MGALLLAASVWAKGTPLAVGFGLSDAAGNLGLSAEVSSPTFARDFLLVRARSEVNYLSAYRNDSDIAWDVFSAHRLGLVGTSGWNSDTTRLYGEFGGLVVIPPSSISKDKAQWGIYGLFGFEFFCRAEEKNPVSLYLEAGTNSLFDKADKLEGEPDYYTGFTTRTGLRFYF